MPDASDQGSLLSGLDDVPWDRLVHFYGLASDVPAAIRSLGGPGRESAIRLLRGNLEHQDGIVQATPFAVRFILRMRAIDPAGVKAIIEPIAAAATYMLRGRGDAKADADWDSLLREDRLAPPGISEQDLDARWEEWNPPADEVDGWAILTLREIEQAGYHTSCRVPRQGFSLVELLVVLGIIAVLIALLMPAISSARRQARSVQCMAQLRDLGHMLQIYQNENDGWLYPCFWNPYVQQQYPTGGTDVPPHLRWPMVVCKPRSAPMPPAYDATQYIQQDYLPTVFPAAPYTPSSLICPADESPVEAHSYVLNGHLCRHGVRAGNHNFGGLTAPEVIYAGEKMNLQRDYFMQNKDFDRVVDPYRHGLMRGSNFLYLDGHAGTVLPRLALTGMDPWDLRTPVVTQP